MISRRCHRIHKRIDRRDGRGPQALATGARPVTKQNSRFLAASAEK
jgi:hypothetical protein